MWIEKILGLHYILFLKTNSRKIKRWRTTTPLKKIESGGLCVRWAREIKEGIWQVNFMDHDLGYYDEQSRIFNYYEPASLIE
jgi:hypothetical protein